MKKIMNTEMLKQLNRSSIRSGRNRNLTSKFIQSLDLSGFHVVAMTMVHNDSEMRVEILVKQRDTMKPARVWLDMSFKEYNALPERRE